jgi:hypothetical protein
MAEINGSAARYRQRAEHLRVMADAKESTGIRQQLLDLAAVYDRLAQEVDDIDASKERRANSLRNRSKPP